MGDEWKASFSREELESMGEDPGPGTPEPKPDEASAPEPEGEPKTGEPEPEPEEGMPKEGEPVPHARWVKFYGKWKDDERAKAEIQQKFDLFKQDRDRYYETYPDERPPDYKPPAPAVAAREKVDILPMRDLLDSVVNDPGQPEFHGQTLEQLIAMGPRGIAAAQDYYREYVDDVREKAREAKEKDADLKRTMEQEDAAFVDARARELFEKGEGELDDTQKGQVEKIVKDTLAWMKTNKRLTYSLEDAWRLMTYDGAIKEAAAKGASALVQHARAGTVKSVATGGASAPADPYARYLGMSEAQLMEVTGAMGDVEYTKFLTEATPAFRKKHPALPYLN